MASAASEWFGATGQRYQFKELIQERQHLGRVWLATSGQEKFVLKDVPANIFSAYDELIRPQIQDNPYIRLPSDTIPDQRIFVYKFLADDFLGLVKKQIPLRARKIILKAALRGLVELHERDVVHFDIKPDNIMVNCRGEGEDTVVEQVQLTDLENAAYLPKDRCIKGMLAGNDNWRSPEGHFKGELNKPSDVYSFGIVCIYAVMQRIIFGVDEDFKYHEAQGALPHLIRLQRQVSYFGDKEGLNGLMKHVGDEEINCKVLGMLWEDRNEDNIPYRPFTDWCDVDDPLFEDLVMQMMNLDPVKRITAKQALDHPWFAGVELG